MTTGHFSYQNYLEASLYGAARGLGGLPFEHPFDAIKTRWQANPLFSSARDVASAMYRERGIWGFYKGALPNAVRAASKQAYRWPLMFVLPPLYGQHLPPRLKTPVLEKAATGLTIAVLETLVVSPLERLKVWKMTTHQRGFTPFFTDHTESITASLSRGLGPVFAKQVTSWITFLVADDYFKTIARRYTGNHTLSFSALLAVSGAVGIINTAVVMPFDMVKTQLQKAGPMERTTLLHTMYVIKHMHGVSGLYTGWQVKMVQYMVQSLFTVTLMDRLEQKFRGHS